MGVFLDPLPLQIRMRDGTVIPVTANRSDTVFNLKELLIAKTGLYPQQQRLVYAGKLLVNEMSLDYYHMPPSAQVYFLPIDRRSPVGERPYKMLSELLHLLSELPSADSGRFLQIINDIRAILSNSTVQASARIDPDIKHLLEDAKETISTAKRPISRRTRDFYAHAGDLALDATDASMDGLRTMKSLLVDTSDHDEEQLQYTNVRYRQRISNQPLPAPWSTVRQDKRSVFHTSALHLSVPTNLPRSVEVGTGKKAPIECGASSSAKYRFSKQLAALKNMGFADEKIILEALAQTDGNVQLAAKLLENRELCK
jgi:hypothetical protein